MNRIYLKNSVMKIIDYKNSVKEKIAYCILELSNSKRIILGWGSHGLTIHRYIFGFRMKKIYESDNLEELKVIFVGEDDFLKKIKEGYPINEKVVVLDAAVDFIIDCASVEEIIKKIEFKKEIFRTDKK